MNSIFIIFTHRDGSFPHKLSFISRTNIMRVSRTRGQCRYGKQMPPNSDRRKRSGIGQSAAVAAALKETKQHGGQVAAAARQAAAAARRRLTSAPSASACSSRPRCLNFIVPRCITAATILYMLSFSSCVKPRMSNDSCGRRRGQLIGTSRPAPCWLYSPPCPRPRPAPRGPSA